MSLTKRLLLVVFLLSAYGSIFAAPPKYEVAAEFTKAQRQELIRERAIYERVVGHLTEANLAFAKVELGPKYEEFAQDLKTLRDPNADAETRARLAAKHSEVLWKVVNEKNLISVSGSGIKVQGKDLWEVVGSERAKEESASRLREIYNGVAEVYKIQSDLYMKNPDMGHSFMLFKQQQLDNGNGNFLTAAKTYRDQATAWNQATSGSGVNVQVPSAEGPMVWKRIKPSADNIEIAKMARDIQAATGAGPETVDRLLEMLTAKELIDPKTGLPDAQAVNETFLGVKKVNTLYRVQFREDVVALAKSLGISEQSTDPKAKSKLKSTVDLTIETKAAMKKKLMDESKMTDAEATTEVERRFAAMKTAAALKVKALFDEAVTKGLITKEAAKELACRCLPESMGVCSLYGGPSGVAHAGSPIGPMQQLGTH